MSLKLKSIWLIPRCLRKKRNGVVSISPHKSNKEHFSGGLAKVLKEQWQVDVRLKAGDSDESSAIPAHKLILASRSEVLKQILESDELKNSSDKVETVSLSEMKQEEVEALVEFMYSDGYVLSANAKKHVRSLYIAADKYEILHLRDQCRQELISSLKLSNVLEILELSQIPFDEDLNGAVFNYIRTNISTIASSAEFEVFVVRNPKLTVEIMKASITGGVRRRGYNNYSGYSSYGTYSY